MTVAPEILAKLGVLAATNRTEPSRCVLAMLAVAPANVVRTYVLAHHLDDPVAVLVADKPVFQHLCAVHRRLHASSLPSSAGAPAAVQRRLCKHLLASLLDPSLTPRARLVLAAVELRTIARNVEAQRRASGSRLAGQAYDSHLVASADVALAIGVGRATVSAELRKLEASDRLRLVGTRRAGRSSRYRNGPLTREQRRSIRGLGDVVEALATGQSDDGLADLVRTATHPIWGWSDNPGRDGFMLLVGDAARAARHEPSAEEGTLPVVEIGISQRREKAAQRWLADRNLAVGPGLVEALDRAMTPELQARVAEARRARMQIVADRRAAVSAAKETEAALGELLREVGRLPRAGEDDAQRMLVEWVGKATALAKASRFDADRAAVTALRRRLIKGGWAAPVAEAQALRVLPVGLAATVGFPPGPDSAGLAAWTERAAQAVTRHPADAARAELLLLLRAAGGWGRDQATAVVDELLGRTVAA